MHIQVTPTIKEYLDRLKINNSKTELNDFLDGYIDIQDEKAAIKELKQAGEQDNIKSLFIEKKDYINNPYLQNINFKDVKLKDFSYETVTIEKGYLFNIDEIQDDKNKELNDYMILRAYKQDTDMMFLKQGKQEWMMASISEFRTNDPYAKKAHGNIITFGLGIGYFVYMASLNENVKSITVIEKSKEVIELFNQIKDQFPNKDINIINGDAFDYFNEQYLKQFDYIYVDIYQNNIDGRTMIEKLLEQYLPPYDKCNFWIENSCLSIVKSLIFIYYYEQVYKTKIKIEKNNIKLMNKVRYYLDNLDLNVNDVNTLKQIMYNKQLIREILHTKVS